MSSIDSYRHSCLGVVVCPSRFPIVHGNPTTRTVAIYRLDEDAPDGDGFSAKRGDILLGGGSGEASALRISMPEALVCLTHEGPGHSAMPPSGTRTSVLKACWTLTSAYVFGDGYSALGWNPAKPIELWLAHHVLSFLVSNYESAYADLVGPVPLQEDGRICRLPTLGERQAGC